MQPITIFVLVPSLVTTSPIKGAVALANGLAGYFPVELVSLKSGGNVPSGLDPTVKVIRLGDIVNPHKRLVCYRSMLQAAGGRRRAISLSLCFSADAISWYMKPHASIVSSVRGNLARNYRYTYGPSGSILATFHYRLLRRFDMVLAMSQAMHCQLADLGVNKTEVIGNFVDEARLSICRLTQQNFDDHFRFLYLGTLERRKRPEVLLEAARVLTAQKVSFHLDVIGDGVLRHKLEWQARGLDQVIFHGHVADPLPLLQRADCLVQPSESEGVSRSVLEALFFGIPCILRNVEAAREIITDGVNGRLFARDQDLAGAMAAMAAKGRDPFDRPRPNRIPDRFRQGPNIKQLAELLSRLPE